MTEDAPEKIPDYLLVKQLRVELGKLEAYIDELKEQLRQKDVQTNRDLIKEIKSEEHYKQLKKKLANYEKENLNLRKTISGLVSNKIINNQQKP